MDTDTVHRRALTATERALVGAAADLGAGGELLAARHLAVDHRLEVLARNWRVAEAELRGELDLIAVDVATDTLVVCEVKTRRDAARFGGALAALGPRQHRRLRALTGAFLRSQPRAFAALRLDLVAVDVGRVGSLTHVQGVG